MPKAVVFPLLQVVSLRGTSIRHEGETEKDLLVAKLDSTSVCKKVSNAQLKFIILYGKRSADPAGKAD